MYGSTSFLKKMSQDYDEKDIQTDITDPPNSPNYDKENIQTDIIDKDEEPLTKKELIGWYFYSFAVSIV